jgi:hypothetical protein
MLNLDSDLRHSYLLVAAHFLRKSIDLAYDPSSQTYQVDGHCIFEDCV